MNRIKSLARRLLQAEGCTDSVEASILLTDDEEIRVLNREYRKIDRPTDVLSFSQVEEDSFPSEEEERLLGDVVISVETAERQAGEHNHSLEEEIDILLVHGLLHLLGYDHSEPGDRQKMFSRQNEILGRSDKPGSDVEAEPGEQKEN